MRLSGAPEEFRRTVGVRNGQNSGQYHRQCGDMGQCFEILCAVTVPHPQPLLTCGFEAEIVALTLCPQDVSVNLLIKNKERRFLKEHKALAGKRHMFFCKFYVNGN